MGITTPEKGKYLPKNPTADDVAYFMKNSLSEEDWNDRCNEVKKNFGGTYPDFWYSLIIMGGLKDEVEEMRKNGYIESTTKEELHETLIENPQTDSNISLDDIEEDKLNNDDKKDNLRYVYTGQGVGNDGGEEQDGDGD